MYEASKASIFLRSLLRRWKYDSANASIMIVVIAPVMCWLSASKQKTATAPPAIAAPVTLARKGSYVGGGATESARRRASKLMREASNPTPPGIKDILAPSN